MSKGVCTNSICRPNPINQAAIWTVYFFDVCINGFLLRYLFRYLVRPLSVFVLNAACLLDKDAVDAFLGVET